MRLARKAWLVVAALAVASAGCGGGQQDGGDELRIVSIVPPSGSTGFPVSAPFVVTFSREIDSATVAPGAVTVNASPGGPVVGALSVTGAAVTLTPAEVLPFDTELSGLDVSALRDVDGRKVGSSPVSWHARTTFGDFDIATPLPRFVDVHYLSPGDVAQVSYLRSGVGHDYADDFESCRSMKHYFLLAPVDWTSVEIRSPVAGRVVERYDEWAGAKLVVRSFEQPAFFFEIFHVTLATNVLVGDAVVAGQLLGHHFGNATYSDIAVGVQSTVDGPRSFIRGRRYVSYFEVLTDARFAEWVTRGMPDRISAQLTAAQRDADPLTCSGEAFTSSSSLPEWLALP